MYSIIHYKQKSFPSRSNFLYVIIQICDDIADYLFSKVRLYEDLEELHQLN